jgi:uncharacterized caspase-like protein
MIVVLAAMAMTLLSAVGQASERVALVIGNSNYQNTLVLRNPANDSADMAATLRQLGFDVIEAQDLDGEKFSEVVSQFSRKLVGVKTALFFYAGHAMQFESVNYLMPVDAKLKNAFQVKREMIALSDIVDLMEAHSPMNLVFLDACRNNPLAEELTQTLIAQGRAVSPTRGLARLETRGRNTLVAFAAGPGREARDGQGRNSPFTASLLRHIPTPDVEIETMLKRVTQDVLRETENFQEPERLSRLTQEFYFKVGDKVAVVDQNQQQTNIIQQNSPFTPDALHWSLVKDTINANLLREFIERYPQSPFRSDAERRLQELENKAQVKKPTGDTESAARFLDNLLPKGTSERYSLTLPQNMRQKLADGLRREGYLSEAVDDYVRSGTDLFTLRFAVLKFQQAEGLAQTGYLTRDAVIRLLSRDADIQQLAATQQLIQTDDTKTDTGTQDTTVKNDAEEFKNMSLSRVERLRIARTLEMMGLTNNGFPESFVESGEVDARFTQAIEAFQKGRGFRVTGYPDADQVRYLVSLGDKKSTWEVEKEAGNSEQNLKLGELTTEQIINRTKLALGQQDTTDESWRQSLKEWQGRNGFEQTGFLNRDVFVRLLDEPVTIPNPNWTIEETFNDWVYWQRGEDEKRCYIWTFATSISGRYAELEMPDMTMSRVPTWPDRHMSATYVRTRWFDTSRPTTIIIDGRSYEMTTREGYYWPRVTGDNIYSDEIMIALSRTSSDVTVVGTSPWGGEMRMVFSASGFTNAFKHMDRQCGRNTLVEWLK